jgi:hypothetical protein
VRGEAKHSSAVLTLEHRQRSGNTEHSILWAIYVHAARPLLWWCCTSSYRSSHVGPPQPAEGIAPRKVSPALSPDAHREHGWAAGPSRPAPG